MKMLLAGDRKQRARWERAARESGLEVSHATEAIGQTEGERFALLAGSAAEVLQGARATGTQTPLLVIPQADSVAAVAYGLLPQLEDGRRIRPAWADCHAAAVAYVLQRLAVGDLGDLTLVECSRVEAPVDAQAGLLGMDVVNQRFLDDVNLLRLIGGDYKRITAVPLAHSGDSVRQMTVTLGGEGVAECVWTITAGETPAWKLSITATRGRAALQRAIDTSITLSINDLPVALPQQNDAAVCLQSFVSPLKETGQNRESPREAAVPAAEWDDLVRAADLLEGLHRSLRRRRTIDLQFESTSERSQFKTQMTAIGCGVLTWAFIGTCLGLLLGSVLDPRDSSERRAAAAGTILRQDDFLPDGSDLLDAARGRIVQQVRIDGPEAIVLIEQRGTNGLSRIDSERLTSVQSLLSASAETRLAQLTVRPLSGGWFRGVMRTIWLVAFVPLAVFLALQLLIAVSRPDGAKRG